MPPTERSDSAVWVEVESNVGNERGDPRVQKRTEIGLSPLRPTAKASPLRPRDAGMPVLMRWIILVLTGGMLVLIFLLGQAAWNRFFGADAGSVVVTQSATQGVVLRLHSRDDFDPPQLALAQQVDPERWAMGFVDGKYRIRSVRPGHLSWSSLGVFNLGIGQVSTQLELSPESPWGYGGLLARFQNDQSFYLFAVDGQGNFQVLLQDDEVWTTLQPWTAAPGIELAGVPNLLTVEDDGARLTFSVNDQLLYEVAQIRLPGGDFGLAGGSQDQAGMQVDFDWVAIYRPE